MKKLQILIFALLLVVFASSSVVYADETGSTQESAVRISREEAEKRAFKDPACQRDKCTAQSLKMSTEDSITR